MRRTRRRPRRIAAGNVGLKASRASNCVRFVGRSVRYVKQSTMPNGGRTRFGSGKLRTAPRLRESAREVAGEGRLFIRSEERGHFDAAAARDQRQMLQPELLVL